MEARRMPRPGTLAPHFILYCILGIVLIAAGAWLANDLDGSRVSIIKERTALSVQTSRFMSQWFGTTIMSTDYVLRDVTTKVAPSELDAAGSDPALRKEFSAMAKRKLGTLPGVIGLALLDRRGVFVAAADEKLVGFKSNSSMRTVPGQVLEDRAYVDYVPASKSASKEPSILVSRPILSPDGRFQGGALAAISLSSAQGWIETFQIGENDTIAMLDSDGILLAINPPKPDAVGKAMKYPAGTPKFGDARGSASFIAVSPVDGRERIFGFSKIETVPLAILVGYDMGRTLQEWRQRAGQLLFGSSILAVLFGFLVYKHFQTLAQREKMREMAITDPLTGLANRRQLTLSGGIEIAKAARYKRATSLLMIDIDHFKAINDTWGHPTGDRVIQALAEAMVKNVRITDLVGRLGGEEFVIILGDTDSAGAHILANRIRESVESSSAVTSDAGSLIVFTVSIGVASIKSGSDTFEELLRQADTALYEAKRHGRNAVVLA
jgi:diguanylate cyclase (GGDEF)-like protein